MDCIQNSTGTIYFDISTEELLDKKIDIEILTENAFIHIKKAIEFLYYQIHIIDSRLLPYPSQLIFLSEFFKINSDPTESHLKKLEEWFWFTSYSNYFTIYSLSQQRQAYKEFLKFALDENLDGNL